MSGAVGLGSAHGLARPGGFRVKAPSFGGPSPRRGRVCCAVVDNSHATGTAAVQTRKPSRWSCGSYGKVQVEHRMHHGVVGGWPRSVVVVLHKPLTDKDTLG